MDGVTDHGALFQEKADHKSSALIFDVTATNPIGPTALARAGTRAGFALEEAVKAENAKYGGTCRPTYKALPLAFSACGDYSATIHDLINDLGRLKAEMDDEYLMAEEAGNSPSGRERPESCGDDSRLQCKPRSPTAPYAAPIVSNFRNVGQRLRSTSPRRRTLRHHRPSELDDTNGTVPSTSRVASDCVLFKLNYCGARGISIGRGD